jgi:hypothetical protein
MARLIKRDNGFALYWEDSGGTMWSFDGLQPNKYLLQLHYTSTGHKNSWAGEVLTKTVTVDLRELKASAPVLANQIEVCALADSIWAAPAAGSASAINLGFRVTKRQKPTWARIIPRIVGVSLRAADGSELAVKKVGVIPPDREPQALHMEPDASRSVVEPAQLTRAGKALVLTWVESDGSVWQVAGLHAGKYAVRYVVQADPGRTPGDWTTWTGAVRTAPVEVVVKE